MVKLIINGKEYDINDMETSKSIKNMIAVKEDTIPEYIHFTTFNKNDIQVEILPIILKKYSRSIEKFNEVFDKLRKEWTDVNVEDLLLLWLKQHTDDDVRLEYISDSMINKFKEINEIDFRNEEQIKKSYDRYIKKYKNKEKELKEEVKKDEKKRKEINKYTKVETTKFIKDTVILEYNIEIDRDPLDLFNDIILVEDIPFVRLNTSEQVYYKVFNNEIPLDDWLEGDNTFIFKLKGKNNWGLASLDYITKTSPYQAKLIIEFEIDVKNKDNSEEELLNKISSILKINIDSKKKIEKGIKGVFAVPEIELDKVVILELITNNPIISRNIYIDEINVLSSQKQVLYLFYSEDDNNDDVVTAFLSQKIATRSDPFFLNKDLPLYTPYLNIRVSRANNIKQINNFMNEIAYILGVYKQDFNNIIDMYRTFIPELKNNVEVISNSENDKKLKELQLQDSELFIYGYPLKCTREKQPTPIKKNEINEWEQNGFQVMNYPLNSDNYFVCPNVNNKYPGLTNNNLNNSDKYEYLPCCYPVDQKIGNKKWVKYLKNDNEQKKVKTVNIIDKKALDDNKLGYLPKNIYYILKKNASKKDEFYRMGVPINNNSFISSVLLSLDKNYETQDNKIEYVNNLRHILASQNISNVVQELYDKDSSQIIKDISDFNIPFDSKYYINLLENVFDCHIIVFTRLNNEINGEIEIPYYTQGYLDNKMTTDKNLVLIYKHIGSRSDNLETPHYELIIKKSGIQNEWFYTNPEKKKDIYKYLFNSYKLYLIGLGEYISPYLNNKLFNTANGQLIDKYGKNRGLIFNDNIYIIFSPLPPFKNIDIKEPPTEKPTINKVMIFIEKYSLNVKKQDLYNNVIVGILLDIKDIPYAYIPIKQSKKLNDIPSGTNLGLFTITTNNILKTTLQNKKIADYLTQFMLYSFSILYNKNHNNNNNPIEDKEYLELTLNTYIKEMIIIRLNNNYNIKNLSRKLSLNNSFFIDNKLIVDSQKTKNNLIFYLKFMLNKNKKFVLNYEQNLYLNNFYTYVNDFNKYNKQHIFIGGLSISNWIESKKGNINITTYNIPPEDKKEPIFFTNWMLEDGHPVIIQNVKDGDLNRALNVSLIYEKEGYNNGYNTQPLEDNIEYTEYSFYNGVIVKKGTSDIKIWKYHNNNYASIII